ncbi:MAG: glycosyltransferase family 2 protein [Cyanobacteria bacterium P01_G01_bin.38]
MFNCSGISVVIPVHNGGENFVHCLSSLAAVQTCCREVIVVADGDSDDSWRRAQSFGARVIRLPESGGPARARNVGAQAASGEILFFMDADVCLHSDTLPKVAAAFEADSNLAALIGSYDDQPGSPNFLSQYRNLLHHYTHQQGAKSANTFWGACGAMRREVFMDLGGFDVTYRRPTIEDIELGYRLKAAGYKIGLYKDIQVKHLKRWEMQSMLKADFFYRALPWTELMLREKRLDNDLNVSVDGRMSVVLSYGLMFSVLTGSLGVWLWPQWLVNSALGTVIACAVGLLRLNWPLYRFFYLKRGPVFALKSLPWHWLYFLYGGLGFAVGLLRHWLRQQQMRTANSGA